MLIDDLDVTDNIKEYDKRLRDIRGTKNIFSSEVGLFILIDGLEVCDNINEYGKRIGVIMDTKEVIRSKVGVSEIKSVLDELTELELKDLVLSLLKDEYHKSGEFKVGDKFLKSRYDVEEIYHCNATAYYPSKSEDEKEIREDEVIGKVEREYFYYYSDCGTVYRSYVETLVGVAYKNNPKLPTYVSSVLEEDDEILVEVVGVIPTDREGDLVFGI